ncbi:hypothetical protein B0H19DRAFT_1135681 [Mycena capillaripes]|nr:hypothetical protein B0H19DRAFT_1135681 [Mycena capillaripes]
MGCESDPGAPFKKFYIETRRRHTTTSYSVKNDNAPLSKLEINTIHASVQSASHDLRNLQRDLKAAKKTAEELTKSVKSVSAFIAAERALLSPIRALPPELLAQIFVHQASASTTHRGYIVAALTVSQVSTGWRTVAHATPALWVRFPIYYLGNFNNTIQKHQVELYRAWHSRSGALSCDVELRRASPAMEKRADNYDEDEDYHQFVFNNDRYYTSERPIQRQRWRQLDIEYRSDDSFRLDDIESVHSLTIHFVEVEKRKRRHELVKIAPQLEELTLRCPPDSSFDRPIFLPILPLQKVKRCEMSSFPFTNGLQVLQQTQALETLKWTTSLCCEEIENTLPKVTTNLHTLDLNVWDVVEGLGPLFNSLTAPELHTLQIKWMYRQDEDEEVTAYWASAEFITFLTRSLATLTSLTLLHADIDEVKLIALLEQTPLLVHFSLSDRYARRHNGIAQMLGPRLLHRLLPSAPEELALAPPLVPKLEVLRLRGGFDGNDICDADILRVFEARYPPASEEQHTEYARLREGALHLMRRADLQLGRKMSLAERAACLVAQGLDFAFTTLEPDPDEDVESESEGSMSS